MTRNHWWIYAVPGRIFVAERGPGLTQPRLAGPYAGLDEVILPAAARVALCVPGASVRIHDVTLPARNRGRFLAALPYALEEQLVRDPDQYHYVPLPAAAGAAVTPVAVIEQQLLHDWRAAIAARGGSLRWLLPDYLLLPMPDPEDWLIDAREAPLLLRHAHGGAAVPGYAALTAEPPASLLLAIEAAARPRRLRLCVADAAAERLVQPWQARLAEAGLDLEITVDPEPRAQYLARQPLGGESGNLLTGPFQPEREISGWTRRLIPGAALAAAIVLALAAQWLVAGARLAARQQELQSAIEAQYRALFPEARNIVDPRFQMESELTRLRSARGPEHEPLQLLSALEAFTMALGADADVQVMSLAFAADGLRLELSARDFETLSGLQQRLAASATVSLDDARLADNRVLGQLRLSERAP